MVSFLIPILAAVLAATPEPPQTATTAGTVEVAVVDPSGAAIPNAQVTVSNRVTGFQRTATTGPDGVARMSNVPPNQYHVEISAPGFQPSAEDLAVRAAVPISRKVTLQLATSTEEVEVHEDANDVIESVPTAHVDIDRSLFSQLPRRAPGQGMSDVITLAAPGVAADSNGMFHPLGDHAETSYSVDNQPITDQQSKQFSNQIPLNIIQSFEAIAGAAPAEYGEKAGLVINAVTRSGLAAPKPFGDIHVGYGSFGTPMVSGSAGWGSAKFGEFLAFNASRSGRYLDSPEFTPLHDIGNNQQFFNRVDFQPDTNDTVHVNLFLARTFFEIPNTWDQEFARQDQRQRLLTYNLAPGWVHTFNANTLLTVNPYIRQDQVRYYPSANAFADTPATVSQSRRLLNYGTKADISYVRGHHNFKTGVQVQRYNLSEGFSFGITDPLLNAPCADPTNGAGVVAPGAVAGACGARGFIESPDFQPGLAAFDLTRGGRPFAFSGRADINEFAWFAQDSITVGGLTASLGLRWNYYNGLVTDNGLQPRLGVSYLFKPTATVLRASYSRFFETPYNENLILSSSTGAGGLAQNAFGAFGVQPLRPGRRDQYNAGLQQGITKHVVFDADYFWKFTRNAFDFDTLFNSPIQFPIEWRKSKIDGLALRVNLVPVHGFSAYTVMGHTRARFFGPENGGILFNSPIESDVFRIDHDQQFEQTTNLRYQPVKDSWWGSFTWRYDSGMVAGRVPDKAAALALDPYQQTAIGVFCGSVVATPSNPIASCPAGQPFGARLLRIPPEGTFDPDHNPARVAPRHLLDATIGNDNLLRAKEGHKWTFQASVVNLTNKVAVYNFLSTFSGTHFVPPRSYRVEIGYVF